MTEYKKNENKKTKGTHYFSTFHQEVFPSKIMSLHIGFVKSVLTKLALLMSVVKQRWTLFKTNGSTSPQIVEDVLVLSKVLM